MQIPIQLLNALDGVPGFVRKDFEDAHHIPAPVSIRINNRKTDTKTVSSSLERNLRAVPWCSDGYYLGSRPVFTLDPILHGGGYYVQEASSMFIQHALSQLLKGKQGLIGLDLCAAPGGKSTLMSTLPQFKLVIANEVIQSRVTILQENVIKWGNGRVLVSNNDPQDFTALGTFFDVVLVDAPCSGSGLFRKDPEAIKEWSTEQVSFCALRQKRILDHAMAMVKPGGFLIYSTCSYSTEENEQNLDYMMNSGQFESAHLETQNEWGIVAVQSEQHHAMGYRFYPHQTEGEGFFCGVLRKTAGQETGLFISGSALKRSVNNTLLSAWLDSTTAFHFIEKDGECFALHQENTLEWMTLKSILRLRRSGLRLGKVIRDELIMDHELALAFDLNNIVPSVALDRKMALSFLRREQIDINATDKGWHWVSFMNIGIGWAKIVQGRLKNHYPLQWRILMRENKSC